MVCHKCFEHCSSVLVQWVEAEASWFLPYHNVLHENPQSTRALFALSIRTLAFHKRQSRSLPQMIFAIISSHPQLYTILKPSNHECIHNHHQKSSHKMDSKSFTFIFLGFKKCATRQADTFSVEFQGLPIWTPGRCHRPECAVPLQKGDIFGSENCW